MREGAWWQNDEDGMKLKGRAPGVFVTADQWSQVRELRRGVGEQDEDNCREQELRTCPRGQCAVAGELEEHSRHRTTAEVVFAAVVLHIGSSGRM